MDTTTHHTPFDVETEYLDAIVILSIDCFLASIEFLSLVNVLSAGIASPVVVVMKHRSRASMTVTHMENGAMRRTTCWEFLGPFLRGISDGSKSGGKYLFKTVNKGVSARSLWYIAVPYLCAQTWWRDKCGCLHNGRV